MELVPWARLAARAQAPNPGPQGQLPPGPPTRRRVRADQLGPVRRVRRPDRLRRLGRRPLPGVPPELEEPAGESLPRRRPPGAQRPQLAPALHVPDRPLAPGFTRGLGG